MAKIIKGDFPARTKKKPAAKRCTPDAAYQLKVILSHCKPPIWRRILVPSRLTLAELHEVIQLCMGWTDTHLHQFEIGKRYFGPQNFDNGWDDFQTLDEHRHKLGELESEIKKGFTYEYDFGDGWLHKIAVEKIVPPEENPPRYPVLLGGKRACPPEDVGGPYGYKDFLEAINDPDHEEHEALQEWLGEGFDPDFFEMTEINTILSKMK
jgi:hypothetical protein